MTKTTCQKTLYVWHDQASQHTVHQQLEKTLAGTGTFHYHNFNLSNHKYDNRT